jgi:hypothetical protein
VSGNHGNDSSKCETIVLTKAEYAGKNRTKREGITNELKGVQFRGKVFEFHPHCGGRECVGDGFIAGLSTVF